MDFAMLPPEINSGRMYGGPGSGPMLAAAAAWNGLAAQLESAASSYRSVVSGLTSGVWLGPASVSMAAAAAPYVGWMSTTAAQAAQTATQAQATAAAYEAAFAATVPPPIVAANRSLLTALVATNLFGQNTPAIAATETQYAEMWAQDAAAMYGYAGSTATVTSGLPTFSPAPQTTTGSSAATSTQTAISQLTATAMQGLASTASADPALAADPLTTLASVAGVTTFLPTIASAGIGALEPVDFATDFADISVDNQDIVIDQEMDPTGVSLVPLAPYGAVETPGSATALSAAEVPEVSAGLGRAASLGGLSVPPGWAVAAPEIRPVALALPFTGPGAAPEVWPGSSGSVFSQMALAGMAGGTIGGTASRGVGRAVSEKLGDTSDSRARVAAAFGGVDPGRNTGYRFAGGNGTDNGEGQLLEQVANRYPAVFALLGALCSPNEHATEASLDKLESQIRALAGRFTAGQ
ncbi:MAG: PPE family protein [Mycobacterium sp.]|nr:PPE family protein [Mycobacterium sp.]MBV9722011.1 PPE family protein [Mycobacterium sp.]